ncbi:hypothetical protein PPERSA_04147 [Pseudocohnilembus persalinus]|uniref:Uncharacterized protein n=1 Tax=Pseudocohnilembus persalinus TaxID=266149 RepID=A0A0V0QMU9_PSEPJ|nr:hypothetical protein PPERSA_04147 [Pseudocohnilembus persalinus]|eukprot:KRX03595.1 hypothetical protein PPERSA_04147 [Pseudocohnilembus persalinus]
MSQQGSSLYRKSTLKLSSNNNINMHNNITLSNCNFSSQNINSADSQIQLKLITKKTDEANDHEGKILSIDIMSQKQLITTAAIDNKVKIWSFQKVLICQINVEYDLQGSIFSDSQGDLVIAHDGKLSLIRGKYLQFPEKDIDELNSQMIEEAQEIDFYNLYTKEKKKEKIIKQKAKFGQRYYKGAVSPHKRLLRDGSQYGSPLKSSLIKLNNSQMYENNENTQVSFQDQDDRNQNEQNKAILIKISNNDESDEIQDIDKEFNQIMLKQEPVKKEKKSKPKVKRNVRASTFQNHKQQDPEIRRLEEEQEERKKRINDFEIEARIKKDSDELKKTTALPILPSNNTKQSHLSLIKSPKILLQKLQQKRYDDDKDYREKIIK